MITKNILNFFLNIIQKIFEFIKNLQEIGKNSKEFSSQLENDNIENILEEIMDNDFYDEEFIYFILGRIY